MLLKVEPELSAVAPGDVVDLLVRVSNDGDEVCHPVLSVRGVDPDDVLVPDEVVAVAPGQVMTAVVRLRAGRDALAGDLRVGLGVTDASGVQAPVSGATVLRVGARPDVALEVDPAATTGRRGAKATTVLRNRSDRRIRVDLEARGDGVGLRFRPPSVVLDPGEMRRVRTRLRPKFRSWFGELRHGAVVTARGVGMPVTTTVTFTQRPAIPRAGIRGVAALAALAVWVAASVFVFQWINAEDPVEAGTVVAAPVTPGPGTTSASDLVEPEDPGPAVPVVIRGTVEGPRTPEGTTVTAERISFGDEGTTEGPTKLVALTGVKLPRGSVLDVVAVTTDERGRFRIASGLIEDAFYRVTVARGGFDVSSRIIATSEEARDIELVVALEPATGALSGSVKDSAGAPIGEATVTVTDGTATYRATTGTEGADAGRWSLEGLSTPADYQVIVARRGFAAQTLIVTLDGGQTRDDVNVTMPTALGSLRGRVTALDPDSGLPAGVGAIDVVLEGEESRTTTTLTGSAALTGSFDFPALPFGTYQLTFSGEGWRTQQAEVAITSGDVQFDTRLLRATGIVQGYVRQVARIDTALGGICRYPTLAQRDAATAEPCGGVLVSLTSEEGDVFATATATIGSATEGLFRIDGVPAGEYTLRASRPGYVDHVERILLGPGETRSVRGSGDASSQLDLEDDFISLGLAAAPSVCTGIIEVSLRDARTGAAVPSDASDDVSLPTELECEDGVAPAFTRLSGSNVYRITNAPLGRTTVTVGHVGYETNSAEVDVTTADTARVTVNLAPYTSLVVALEDASGSPVEGAEVIVFPASGTPGTNAGTGVTECTRTIAADGAFAGEEVSGLCATTGSDGEASLPQALGLGTWRVSTPVNTTVTDTALDFRPTLLSDIVSITTNTAGAAQSVSGSLERFAALTGQVFVFDDTSGAFVAGGDGLFGASLEDFPDLASDGQGIQLRLFEGGVGTAFPTARTPRLTYSVSGGVATYRIDRIQPDEAGATRTYELRAAVLDGASPREHVIGTADLGGFAYDEVRTGVDLRLREPSPVDVTVLVQEAEALGDVAGSAGPTRPIEDARVQVTGSAGFDQQRPPQQTVETCPSPICVGFTSTADAGVVESGAELWLETGSDGRTRTMEDIFTAGAASSPLTIEAEATGYRSLDLAASPPVGSVTGGTIASTDVTVTVTLPFDTVTWSGTVTELVTTADATATASLAGATVTASVTVGGTTYTRESTSGSDGTYSLTLPVGYDWTVNATLDDYAYATGSEAIVKTTASGVDLTGQDLTLERTSGVVLRGDVTVDSGDEVEVRVFVEPSGTTQLGASYFIGAGGEFVFPTVLPAGSVYRVEFHVGSDAAAASASTSATATRWIDANPTPAGIEPATVLLEQDVSDGSTATVTVRVVNPAADSATVNVELSEIGPFPTLGPDGELPTQNVAVGSDEQEDVEFEAVPLRGSDRSILADRLRLNVTVPSGFVIDDITVGPDSLTSDSDGRLITDAAHAGGVTVVVSLAGSPGVPTIDSITPGDEELEIAFTLNSVDGGRSIDDVEYSTDDGGTWTAFTSTTSPGTISGLDNGTSYNVRIRAVNNIGPSAASVAATATPRTVPGAPTITSIVEGDGQLSVAFTGPVSDGGATITNYEYSTDDGSNWTVRSPSSVASPIEISGLANGTTYRVRIRAVNDAGPGAASTAQSASPQAPFAVATGGSITCERSDGTTVACADSDAAFKVHTFAGTSAGAGTTGTFTVTSAPPAAFDIWVIGGGGAGGTGPNSNDGGGGGGGGGSAYAAGASLSAGSFTVTAGAGGAKPTTTGTGAAGAASSLTDSSGSVLIRATGANGGTATTGGAGGNASAETLSYTAGQGGTGGAGNVGSGSNGSNGGAGGGGGGDGVSAVGGSGGNGSSIGARLFSGGGGGGATDDSGSGTSTPAQGGSGFGDGGAGNGLQSSNTSAEDGGGTVGGAGGSAGASRVNSGGGGGAYGGGGGGGADFNLGGGLGGGGGGGVVIIRYAIS